MAPTLHLLALSATATPPQFAGFVHITAWDGQFEGYGVRIGMPLAYIPSQDFTCAPSEQKYYNNPPNGISKDLCTTDRQCRFFNTGPGPCSTAFGNFSATPFDTYLATLPRENSTAGAVCAIESGGGNTPQNPWLYCSPMCPWQEPVLLASYTNTTAAHIRDACVADPQCLGFRVNMNHQTAGDTLGHSCNTGRGARTWLKLPTSTPIPSPPLRACSAKCQAAHCEGGSCLSSTEECWSASEISGNECAQHKDWCWCE